MDCCRRTQDRGLDAGEEGEGCGVCGCGCEGVCRCEGHVCVGVWGERGLCGVGDVFTHMHKSLCSLLLLVLRN